MKNLLIILVTSVLFGFTHSSTASLCDSFQVTTEVLDYVDSVSTSGKKTYLKPSENWANNDFQIGYGFRKIPDSILIKVYVLPEEFMNGPVYTSGAIELLVTLGLKFGQGLDCINIKSPMVREDVAKKMFNLGEKDFMAQVSKNAVRPVTLTVRVPLTNLLKKNSAENYHLNQLMISTRVSNVKKQSCTIEYIRPICSKKIESYRIPN